LLPQCNPSTYKYGLNAYQDYVKYRRDQAVDHIHGAGILMITLGHANPGEYEAYYEQIDTLRTRYLAEFQAKQEQPA
jgi:hypothetical protein